MQTPDVIIVQKQTALERYTRRPMNVDFYEYLQRAGQSLDDLIAAHEEHLASRTLLMRALAKASISYLILNLDELEEGGYQFFRPGDPNSGIQTKLGAVVSLGGDGTLLHTAHFVGGDTVLLGVNSSPRFSVGHLCAAQSHQSELVAEILRSKTAQWQSVARLHVRLSVGKQLPLALNDVLVCHQHPAATSRYRVSLWEDGQEVFSEKHLSSGLWVATPAGSTAAVSAYVAKPLALGEKSFLVAARELYDHAGTGGHLRLKECKGDKHEIEIFMRMRQGLVCVDGPDAVAPLGFGETVRISMGRDADLRLVFLKS